MSKKSTRNVSPLLITTWFPDDPIEYYSAAEWAAIEEAASASGKSLEEFILDGAKEELARRARNIIKFPSGEFQPS